MNRDADTDYIAPARARRNFALYSDKPSRKTGNIVNHLEARFKGKLPCRNAIDRDAHDFVTLRDLWSLDHREFWRRYLWLLRVDEDAFSRRLAVLAHDDFADDKYTSQDQISARMDQIERWAKLKYRWAQHKSEVPRGRWRGWIKAE